MSSLDDPLKTAAIDVIVRYARDVARLPPIDVPLLGLDALASPSVAPSVLKPVATDKVLGEVLPRACDTWLALLPFDDLTKKVSDTTKQALIQKRRGLLEIVANVGSASSSPFRLDASSRMCRADQSANPGNPRNRFWIDLMRALDPEADGDNTNEMARCLIAMSQTQSLRFMLGVTQEVVPTDLPEMIARMHEPLTDAASMTSVTNVLAACGVMRESMRRVTVDIGLSFSKAKISPAFLTKLLDVIDRCSRQNGSERGIVLRVTSLRFGRNCVFQPKAIDVLVEGKIRPSLTYLGLGDLHGVKPASLRLGITGVLNQLQGLRRLATTPRAGFEAVAAALRTGDTLVEELDVAFEPTVESAAWLAFAFFHVDSKSPVSSLHLRFPRRKHISQFAASQEGVLNEDWLTAFKRALRSTTADQDLACLEGSSEDQDEHDPSPRRFVTIKVGTAVKAEPYTSAKTQCKIENEVETFEAIATVRKSLAVIVPGLGVGWVPTTSVTSEKFVASRLSTASGKFQTNRTIKSLVWDCAIPLCNNRPFDGHVKVLLEVLQIVGEPLERLHLPALKLTTEEFAKVLTVCPNLTELNVTGHAMASISPLVDAYASGRCQIDTLNIERVGMCVRHDSIPQELTALLLGLHGHRLRRLAVHLTPMCLGTGTSSVEHKEGTRVLVQALGSSDSLEFVQLSGSSLWEAARDEHVSSLALPVNMSAHPLCVSNMPMRHKLAFLSCVQSQVANRALRGFDACILAQIFRFTSHCVARHVLMDAPLALQSSARHG